MNTNRTKFTVIACVMTALVMSACGSPSQPAQPTSVAQPVEAVEATATPQPPVVDLMAMDTAFTLPKSVPADLVTLNFMNHGKEFHHAIIVRLSKPDTPMEKIMEALDKPEDPDFVDFSQGAYTGVVDPNGSMQLTTSFAPGKYLTLCFIAGEDGVPHAAKGMIGTFDVVTNTNAAQIVEPKADLVVTLKKDGVDFPKEVKAGKQTWKVVNETGNPEASGVYVSKLLEGKTRADLEQCVTGDSCTPATAPGNAIGGGGSNSGTTWLTLDLKPGDNYWLQTDVPDPSVPTPTSQDQEPKTIWLQFAVK